VTRLIFRGQQAECCCLHEVGRAICSWNGLDDIFNYDQKDEGYVGPEYPWEPGYVSEERVTALDDGVWQPDRTEAR